MPATSQKQTESFAESTFKLSCDSLHYADLIGPHLQESWELDFIKHGYGVHTFNNITEPCNEGELILIPPYTIHSWIIDPQSVDSQGRVESFTLTFTPASLHSRLSAFPELSNVLTFFKGIDAPLEICGDTAERVKALIMSMAQEDFDSQLPFFLSILLRIAKSPHLRFINSIQPCTKIPKSLSIVQKAYQFILNNYSRHITLDEVASLVAMNKSSFCSLFKRHYTQSFFFVLNEHRIHMACIMLCAKPYRDIADIGYAVGFNDIPYFHRTFKRFKGCSPLQYRQRVTSLHSI